MAIHDAYLRTTPLELLLPGDDFAEEHFPRVAEEIEERGGGGTDPESFVLLMTVGEALRELKGPGDEGETIHEHGALLFHAYHVWRADGPAYLLSTHAARYLVETDPETPGRVVPPTRAGYLQLPQHLFWSPGEDGGGAAPESLDGLFWTWNPGEGGGVLHLLACMGLREGRPGFTVAPLPPLMPGEVQPLLTESIRGDGRDFQSELPGAELEGLYEVRTAAELVKLVGRVLAYLDEVGEEAVAGESPPEPDDGGEGSGPSASGLDARRIVLV